ALDDAGDKLSESDKEQARRECDDALKWLDSNTLAEKEEYEHKLKDLQRVCSPVMSKMHGAANGAGGYPGSQQGQPGFQGHQQGSNGYPGYQQQQQYSGPTVEEVD
ncbi:jg5092, partial [Pararge aegeria aegeria]